MKQSKEQRKEYHQTCKLQVIQKYGGECVYCHSNELAVLTIDHINDDGNKEKNRKQSRKFYYDLRISPLRNDLQILCGSCQLRKRIYGNDFSTWESQKITTNTQARLIRTYPPSITT
jgi:hypothetical protein